MLGPPLLTRIIVILLTLVVGFIYGGCESGLLSLQDISGPANYYGLGNYLPYCGGNVSNVFSMFGIPHKYDCRYQLRVESLRKRFPVGTKQSDLIAALGKPNEVSDYRACGEPTRELWVYDDPLTYLEIKDEKLTEVCNEHYH